MIASTCRSRRAPAECANSSASPMRCLLSKAWAASATSSGDLGVGHASAASLATLNLACTVCHLLPVREHPLGAPVVLLGHHRSPPTGSLTRWPKLKRLHSPRVKRSFFRSFSSSSTVSVSAMCCRPRVRARMECRTHQSIPLRARCNGSHRSASVRRCHRVLQIFNH
jgi:hypothetical protein